MLNVHFFHCLNNFLLLLLPLQISTYEWVFFFVGIFMYLFLFILYGLLIKLFPRKIIGTFLYDFKICNI